MKKFIIFLMFFLLVLTSVKTEDNAAGVMAPVNSNSDYYELNFKDEILNLRNFKLKLGLFTSYEYKITKVYIDYPESIKEYFNDKKYFSFNGNNLSAGIENLKYEYNLVLKENYLYEELEKNMDDIVISRVDIYCEKEAIEKFKEKYKNVIINVL